MTGLAAATLAVAMVAPAIAQEEPVKAGVEAWERGDYKTAVERWRMPAVQGNPDAQFNLAQAYKLGRGVPADLNQAEDWYRKAAMQGHMQAEDNYGLTLFQNGKREQAVRWLERSAARGEPRAQYVLGTMHFNGDAVLRDWVRAYALTVRAAASGLPQANSALAQMDRYVSLQDRQAGLALARRYEEEARRPQAAALPPLDAPAETRPAPVKSQPVQSPPVRKPAAPAPAPAAHDGGWRVQLGAFGQPGNARRLWGEVRGRFPGRAPEFVRAGSLTRLLVGPYASRAEALRACAAVKPCVPVRK